MKKKLLIGLAFGVFLVATAGIAIAVDESTVQQIQTDVATTKNKADGNDNKITGLNDNVTNLQNQIDNIKLIPGPPGEQGLQGETGSQGIQGERGPQGLAGAIDVYDANGQYLGIFIGLERTHAGDDRPSTRIYLPEVNSILNIRHDRETQTII